MARHTFPLPHAPQPDPAPANDAGHMPDRDLPMGRLLISVAEARLALGIGHTKIYELLRDGELEARRLGGRTLVEVASLRRFVAALEPARFGTRETASATTQRRGVARRR